MNQKSTDQLLEALSALVDDEASELEVRRILKNVEDNTELLEHWRRYHLAGSIMRREQGIYVEKPTQFAQSIAAMVDKEPAMYSTDWSADHKANTLAGGSAGVGRWKDLLGKTSIAASFAVALVVGFNYLGGGSRSDGVQPTLVQSPVAKAEGESVVSVAPLGFELPSLEARTVSNQSSPSLLHQNASVRVAQQADDITDVATQDMLNQLLIFHAERASVNGGLGLMPFARVSKMQEFR